MKILLVGGTWSFRNDGKKMWHHAGSPFSEYLKGLGHEILFGYNFKGERILPMEWDSNIGGFGGDYGKIGWATLGSQIYNWVVPSLCYDSRVSPEELLIINHSHGLQGSLFAFDMGLKGSMISICGPVRCDMEGVVASAKRNILNWVSLHSDSSDIIQIAGSDVRPWFPFRRAWEESDLTIQVDNAGHEGLINMDRLFFHTKMAIDWIQGNKSLNA